MGNNPIYNIDVDGKYFTGNTEVVKNLYAIVSFLAKLGIKGAAEYKAKLEKMDQSDVEFNIQTPTKWNSSGEGGYTKFNFAENRVDIVVYNYPGSVGEQTPQSFENRAAHELLHGAQFLEGKIDFFAYDNGTDAPANAYDVTDEKEAFATGRMISDNQRSFNNSPISLETKEKQILDLYRKKGIPEGPFETTGEQTNKIDQALPFNSGVGIVVKYASAFNYQPTEKQKAEKKSILKQE